MRPATASLATAATTTAAALNAGDLARARREQTLSTASLQRVIGSAVSEHAPDPSYDEEWGTGPEAAGRVVCVDIFCGGGGEGRRPAARHSAPLKKTRDAAEDAKQQSALPPQVQGQSLGQGQPRQDQGQGQGQGQPQSLAAVTLQQGEPRAYNVRKVKLVKW